MKIRFWLICCCSLLAIGCAYGDVAVPTPVLPHPNAYDFFAKAAKSLVDVKTIDYASGIMTEPDHFPMTEAARTVLGKNAESLRLVRAGFAYESHYPPIRSAHPNPDPVKLLARMRSLARLLVWEGYLKSKRGDWQGTANCDLDAMMLGVKLSKGGTLLVVLVGTACEAIGRRHFWEAWTHLNPSQLRVVAARLSGIIERHPRFLSTLTEEKWSMTSQLHESFQEKHWPNEPPFSQWTESQVIENFTRSIDKLMLRDGKPYGEQIAEFSVPKDPWNHEIIPMYMRCPFHFARNDSQESLLFLTLLLHLYYFDHHTYPATLAELAPAYIPKIPRDPFGNGEPIHYKRTKSSYLLYSVGPDRYDDGGTAIDDPLRDPTGKNPRSRYITTPESKGDMVAGINP